jgi:hypothetical protein
MWPWLWTWRQNISSHHNQHSWLRFWKLSSPPTVIKKDISDVIQFSLPSAPITEKQLDLIKVICLDTEWWSSVLLCLHGAISVHLLLLPGELPRMTTAPPIINAGRALKATCGSSYYVPGVAFSGMAPTDFCLGPGAHLHQYSATVDLSTNAQIHTIHHWPCFSNPTYIRSVTDPQNTQNIGHQLILYINPPILTSCVWTYIWGFFWDWKWNFCPLISLLPLATSPWGTATVLGDVQDERKYPKPAHCLPSIPDPITMDI